MKLKFLILLVLFAANAMASSGVGNGGYSVVCRNDKKEIISAELLDIFEGRMLYYYDYSNNPDLTEKELIQFSLENIRKVNGRFAMQVEKEIASLNARITFIAEDLVLEDTNDAFPTIGRRDCKMEQLANYTDNERLLISTEIFNSLPTLHKAALKIHEAIYYLARKAGEKNSKNSRLVAAWSFAIGVQPSERIISTVNAISKPLAKPEKDKCGMSGNMDERILDCDKSITTKTGQQWQLITRETTRSYDKSINRRTDVYLTPTKRVVTLVDMDTYDLDKKTAKIRATNYSRMSVNNEICSSASSFNLYPDEQTRDLNVTMKLPNKADLEELFLRQDIAEVFDFKEIRDIPFDETFKNQTACNLYEFYWIYSSGWDVGRGSRGIDCSLPLFNPNARVMFDNHNTNAESLKFLCIE